METILMSIQPKWCEKIINGEKTIEVRKTAPKEVPFKVYIYCTKEEPNLYIPAEFNCFPLDEASQPYFAKEPFVVEVDNLANGKVIGEFICDYVEKEAVAFTEMGNLGRLYHCRLSLAELKKYAGERTSLYYWHISALKVYDKPKELSDFYSIKQCKPEYSPFGYQWTWEDRHKRNTGGRNNKYRPVPIECHRCKSLVGGKDYLDEKSGCILFDYKCTSNYHKPLARPPQSWQYIQELENNND